MLTPGRVCSECASPDTLPQMSPSLPAPFPQDWSSGDAGSPVPKLGYSWADWARWSPNSSSPFKILNHPIPALMLSPLSCLHVVSQMMDLFTACVAPASSSQHVSSDRTEAFVVFRAVSPFLVLSAAVYPETALMFPGSLRRLLLLCRFFPSSLCLSRCCLQIKKQGRKQCSK